MSTPSFDVFEHPWIPVLDEQRDSGAGADSSEGGVRKQVRHRNVSLYEAFTRAHQLRWIDAEAPVVTAALYRLLLAFAHRIYGPESKSAWEELWDCDAFEGGKLVEYRERYRARFDLFGQERPFLQCPSLPQEKMGSAAQLVLGRSVGNNVTLFDRTTADEHPELKPDEAARWLVTLHAFDAGGLKTPYLRDKSSERGPCNHFGATLVEGSTLKETLLLNLVVYAPGRGLPSPTRPEDSPPWERDQPPSPEPDKQGRTPRGWVDRLTWPSRRILLKPAQRGDDVVVDHVVVTPGERVDGDLSQAELMAAFVQYRKKGTKGKQQWYPQGPTKPVVLEELRGVWRHCCELLLDAAPNDPRQRPRVLTHVAENAPDDAVYTLRVFGQRLNSQGGAVEAWMQESVPAPVALLRAGADHKIQNLLGFAVELANEVGSALEWLETEYDKELTNQQGHKGKRSMLTQWYWPRLSEPFGELLSSVGHVLNDDRELFTLFSKWRTRVSRLGTEATRTWAQRSPRGSGRQIMALAGTENRFHAQRHRLDEQYGIKLNSVFPPEDEED